jgi:hypothetical protein
MRTAALIVALLTTVTASAQQRDRPAAPAATAVTGTALVSGVVTVAAGSSTPARRAVVSLISADGLTGRSVVTDDKGTFTFRNVPEGRYSLSAQKPAHLKNSYGAKRPGRPGSSIVLAAGQQLTGLTFALPAGGVLAGTLRLESGEPLADTQVMAVPVAQATAGGTTFSQGSAEFVSDDEGAFRIYGLAPGTYVLMALPIVGRGEVEHRSEADYEALVRQLTPAPGRAPATTPDVRGYAPTYFPGTAVVTEAVPITIAAGEVKDGLDIPITMFRMSSISGTVVGTDGRPLQAVQISASPVGPALPLQSGNSPRANRPDAEGRYTMTNVAPGTYQIIARAGGITLGADGATMSISTDGQTEWATANVVVAGANVEGVHLIMQPGLTFEGQVVAENAPAGAFKNARVTIQPVGMNASQVAMNGLAAGVPVRSTAVADTGAFRVTGLQPGLYEITLRTPGLGTTWTVQSIVAGGRDVRDAPLTFQDGSMTGATISVSNQRSEVAGTLSAASGIPASDYYVVVFAGDKALWHPTSPRIRMVRPAADGAFSIRDLPVGDYRIAALTDVEDDELKSTTFLASLVDASIPVTIASGQVTRQDIRIR